MLLTNICSINLDAMHVKDTGLLFEARYFVSDLNLLLYNGAVFMSYNLSLHI